MLNLFNPDGMLVDHNDLAKLTIHDAVVHLREQKVPLTIEFMAYVCMAFLFPHNPDLAGWGHDISGGSNPMQGLLYHFLITNVFSVAVAKKLVPEFLNFAPKDNPDFYLQYKQSSEDKVSRLKEYCVSKNADFMAPDLPDFYFRKPSELDDASRRLTAPAAEE